MTFKTWIKDFEDDDTPFGDLARDIKIDEEFPVTKKFEKIARHLRDLNACQGAMRTFGEAFIEFFACNDEWELATKKLRGNKHGIKRIN